MSNNLLYNGNFSLPSITANTFVDTSTFSTQQATDFYWLTNGDIPVTNLYNGLAGGIYPDPVLINVIQFLEIHNAAYIEQSFTVINTGAYRLNFYYAKRIDWNLNNVQIFINGVLIDTLTTNPTSWQTYTKLVDLNSAGTNTILFLGQEDIDQLYITALTKIEIIYIPPVEVTPPPGVIVPPGIPATSNSLKSTNIFGFLNVNDYIVGGVTTQGILSSKLFNFLYTTLPTFSNKSLGYSLAYTSTVTSVTANSFTNSSVISVPVGVYIVEAYANITPTTSAQYQLRLGINTAISTYSNTYNYTSDINPASLLVKSIKYITHLSVATTTNFYFVFNTSVAGNLNGTLKGKFIRIA